MVLAIIENSQHFRPSRNTRIYARFIGLAGNAII